MKKSRYDTRDKIRVFLKFENGRCVCICNRDDKRCNCTDCYPDVVFRDRYYGWKEVFKRDRYGN